jgi:hypothetical protein
VKGSINHKEILDLDLQKKENNFNFLNEKFHRKPIRLHSTINVPNRTMTMPTMGLIGITTIMDGIRRTTTTMGMARKKRIDIPIAGISHPAADNRSPIQMIRHRRRLPTLPMFIASKFVRRSPKGEANNNLWRSTMPSQTTPMEH